MAEEIKTYPQMRREFYEKYQKNILPCVRKFDAERKKKLIMASSIGGVLILLGLVCIFLNFYWHLEGESSESAIKLAAFAFFGAWVNWTAIKKNFENKVKSKIMPTVCSCFNDMTWAQGYYWGANLFVDSCLISEFTNEQYDDIFECTYKDVNMQIVESVYTRGSGKNKTTLFEGVIVKLSMNKNFTGHTVIAPDTFFHATPNEWLRHTTLEDVVFEKKFDVFTNDEVEARYLITPSFMERLNNIKTSFRADKIKCAFYKDMFILVLSTPKDLFSLCSLVKPMDDHQQYFQMYEEIISIIKLIDHFKLDQKIGL